MTTYEEVKSVIILSVVQQTFNLGEIVLPFLLLTPHKEWRVKYMYLCSVYKSHMCPLSAALGFLFVLIASLNTHLSFTWDGVTRARV